MPKRRTSTRKQRRQPGSADPATALALVAANVPLPRATAGALRLVCRATRLAVDESTTELELQAKNAALMPTQATPLTTGLASLRFSDKKGTVSEDLNLSNALEVAHSNSESLETFDIFGCVTRKWGRTHASRALRVLRSQPWPNLRSLSLPSVKSLFHYSLNVDSLFPSLIELRLTGDLLPRDVAALARCQRFTSSVEILSMALINVGRTYQPFYDQLKSLLTATTKLRHLSLDIYGMENITFLSTELPNLEVLELLDALNVESLEPIYRFPRERLHTLVVEGVGDLAVPALITSTSLPALKTLAFHSPRCEGWEFMQNINLTSLKSLVFFDCLMDIADIEAVGKALGRLPALESLELNTDFDNPALHHADEGMRILLISAPQLPRLLRLATGGGWRDSNESLQVLIAHAHKVPNLEEIIMEEGCFDDDGLLKLAAAGRCGVWPRLKLFHIGTYDAEWESHEETDEEGGEENGQRAVLEAWPGLEFKFEQRGRDMEAVEIWPVWQLARSDSSSSYSE